MLSQLIEKIVIDYKTEPRNKIFIDELTLLAAAAEETGNDVSDAQLRLVIRNFLSGEMDGDDYSIYDGAIYACAVVSNKCFGDPEANEDDDDYSVDYEINWIENNDGSFCAEIRPT
jgi:hypothetical protein